MKKNEIYIDPEFRDLMPVLSPDALAQLEASIVKEGCRDPLIVWENGGKQILLDGHNRLVICDVHGIKYKVIFKGRKEIPNRDAAIEWIIRNQLARRNLTPEQFTLYLGKLYDAQRRQGTRTDRTSAQNEQKLDGEQETTAERMAREHGVSPATVRRAGELADAIEKLKKDDPEIEQRFIRGEVTRKEVMAKAKPPTAPEMQEPPKDDDGREIPAHLIVAFATQEQFKRFAQTLSTLKGQVKQAIEENPVAWSQFSENEFRSLVQRAHDLLKLSGPFIVCAYCGGSDSDKCGACKGAGFLSRAKARCAPKELRP